MYSILYKKSVEKELIKLPKTTKIQIIKKIQALRDDPGPNGSVKLRGSSNLYRIRHLDYRIIYSIDSGVLTIFVIKIAHRKEVYKNI